jgi:hypothetical protein
VIGKHWQWAQLEGVEGYNYKTNYKQVRTLTWSRSTMINIRCTPFFLANYLSDIVSLLPWPSLHWEVLLRNRSSWIWMGEPIAIASLREVYEFVRLSILIRFITIFTNAVFSSVNTRLQEYLFLETMYSNSRYCVIQMSAHGSTFIPVRPFHAPLRE